MKTSNVQLRREAGFGLLVAGLLVAAVVTLGDYFASAVSEGQDTAWRSQFSQGLDQQFLKKPKSHFKQTFKLVGVAVPLFDPAQITLPPVSILCQRDGGYNNALIDNEAFRLRL